MAAISEDALSRLSFKPLQPSINPRILLYTPETPAISQASARPCPRVIILATWLGGATSARIAIYCRAYQRIYPSTPILVIRTVIADMSTKSLAAMQDALRPARDYLLSLFGSTPSTPLRDGALLHMFSHGGCNSGIQLSHLLRDTSSQHMPATALPIPLIGVILDSCPGSNEFGKFFAAATYSLPASQPANLVGRALLLPFVGFFWTLQQVGAVSSIADLRSELNDASTFGVVPRLYLHSEADKLVAPEDVASHAEDLAKTGVKVRRETWERAMHCALPAGDPERYWNAIQAFVADDCSARGTKL